jgi:hypothetical protein
MNRGIVYATASFFSALSILFVPFPFNLSKIQIGITDFIFGDLISFISKNVFGKRLADSEVHSDTTSMYVLMVLLFFVSLAIALILTRTKNWLHRKDKIFQAIYLLAVYYLALQLLKYGLDKIFKNQFYIPEPNTLFTPLGKVPRDLLYWSSLSTSRFYNIFLGSIEAIAAILLMIKRTRTLGLLISLFTIANILAVNFGFDISVKLFSLLLLYLNLYLLYPNLKELYNYFFTQNTVERRPLFTFIKNPFWSFSIKFIIVAVILLEASRPFISSGNFNGDAVGRPYMHGAYEVKSYVSDADSLVLHEFPVRRFFIHKDSYIIFQDQNDNMIDYELIYDRSGYAFYDYRKKIKFPVEIQYNRSDSVLTLHFKSAFITGKGMNWRQMPALKREFHWTID